MRCGKYPKFHFMFSALKDRMQEFGGLSDYMSSNKRGSDASAENGIIVAAEPVCQVLPASDLLGPGNKGFREGVRLPWCRNLIERDRPSRRDIQTTISHRKLRTR